MNATTSILHEPGLSARSRAVTPLARYRYYPDNGIEVAAVTEFQMREIEKLADEVTGPEAQYRTERAGLSLALLTVELLGTGAHHARILVLAGAGMAGEAGICAARHLQELRMNVTLCLSQPRLARQELSYQHCQYRSLPGKETKLWNLHDRKFDWIIDSLGGDGPVRGNTPALIRWINNTGAPLLSFDIPAGIHPTTGHISGDFIHASATLGAGLPRTGLLPDLCGKLFLADIGLRAGTMERAGIPYVSPFENRLWVPLDCTADNGRLDW